MSSNTIIANISESFSLKQYPVVFCFYFVYLAIMDISDKKEQLIDFFSRYKEGHLLYSAGMDSSALLGAAVKAGCKLVPYWIDNGFNRTAADDIRKQAENLGSDLLRVNGVKPNSDVESNSNQRCFHCKNQILDTIPVDGNPVFDGTTASDLGGFRPGRRALREYGVISPLAELGITSEEARLIAKDFGAEPYLAEMESCLATRINYDIPITKERLDAIRRIEKYVIEQTGDFDVRCRIDDEDHIRIEFKKKDSYKYIADEKFRRTLFELGKPVSLFVTVDVLSSRPNTYDKRLKPSKQHL
ncbi:MAG: exoenzyme S synthesis protein B [Chlorobi bacterium]|nr:exoenzyme S synthesis protein B [Chlorobiota bacterium]